MSSAASRSAQSAQRFEIYSRAEILAILRDIVKAQETVTLESLRTGEIFVTRLLEVHPMFEELVFDCAVRPEVNERLVRSGALRITTRLRKVEIVFCTEGAQQVQRSGQCALRAPIPKLVTRLQRREHYRAPTPVGRPLICRLPVDGRNGRRINARVLDISCGGIALIALPGEPGWRPFERFERCELELPGEGVLVGTLEVRHAEEASSNEKATRRYGCQFVDFPEEVLMRIQRVVIALERQAARSR